MLSTQEPGSVQFYSIFQKFADFNCQQAWIYPEATGIGAGIDSFYEYALKWYIMSGKHSSPTLRNLDRH